MRWRWTWLFLLSGGIGAWPGCRPEPAPPPQSPADDRTDAKAPEPPRPEKAAPKPVEEQEPAPTAQPKPEKPPAEPAPKPPEPAPKFEPLAQQEQGRRLAQARELAAAGHWAQAQEIAQTLLHNSPTAATRQQAGKLAAFLQQRLAEAAALQPAVHLLATAGREEVRAAQDRLFEKSDAALPLLREAAGQDNPLLMSNLLDTLPRLGRPEAALPIMVEVLANPAQKAYWSETIRHIEAANAPGAGGPLLKLVESAASVPQRMAALDALSRAFDPPPQTAVTLLPMLFEDRPELPAMLAAAAHAIVVHGQSDLLSLRGFDFPLTARQIAQLERLPSRLTQLMSGGSPPALAQAARLLATVTRLVPPAPLSGVKIASVSAELDGSPATALLDGAWDSVEPATMWKHPIDKRAWVTFDLGGRRTIVGLRIWNLNESGGAHRGWKELAIYVGDAPLGATVPAATATLQRAPGIAKPPDYGTLVPLPLLRGRYLRLQMLSPWQQDSHGGLSEVQILGF